eukprot:Amastigsp_a677448_26.p3 type:complete len:143 gc:universal Amastigsp_a677448_26:664-1092(+)
MGVLACGRCNHSVALRVLHAGDDHNNADARAARRVLRATVVLLFRDGVAVHALHLRAKPPLGHRLVFRALACLCRRHGRVAAGPRRRGARGSCAALCRADGGRGHAQRVDLGPVHKAHGACRGALRSLGARRRQRWALDAAA